MAKAKPLTDQNGVQQGYSIECPACGFGHFFNVEQPGPSGQKWSFNGDLEKPTFSPSMRSRTGHYCLDQNDSQCKRCAEAKRLGKSSRCTHCHSFVRDGKIEFLSDCSHDMAGQTVELPDVDGDFSQ